MAASKAAARSRTTDRSVILNQCSGCGGEIALEHEFDITRCEHCGSLLRVSVPPELPAYYLRSRISKAEAIAKIERFLRSQGLLGRESLSEPDMWLIPYWFFTGQLLKRRVSREIVASKAMTDQELSFDDLSANGEEKEVSLVSLTPTTVTSLALTGASPYPQHISLGQHIVARYPLVGLGTDVDWQVASPRGNAHDASNQCASRIASNGSLFEGGISKNPTELFVHDSSVLFVPFYRWRDESLGGVTIVVDASSGEIATVEETAHLIDTADPVVHYATELKMELHRCTHCSHDLPDASSCVYRCENCGRFAFRGIDASSVFALAADSTPHTSFSWLPYWVSKGNGERDVVPAFHIRNLEVAFRISRQLCGIIKGRQLSSDLTRVNNPSLASLPMKSCNSFRSAMRSRYILERDTSSGIFVNSPQNFLQKRAFANDWNLVFVPFTRVGYEYTDALVQAVTFPVQAIAQKQ